jgi:predicted ArsR family transcriptional regulator
MPAAGLGRRFLESTRGRIVALLRRGPRTVEELAQALALTDNAVRNHLATLERDGLIRQQGLRRSAGAGKPAVLYEIHPDAEPLLSDAYVPALSAVMDVLVEELPRDQAADLLQKVGTRLASLLGGGGEATVAGTVQDRANAAAALLRSLGGEVDVVTEGGELVVRGAACPLSATVSRRPETCRAMEALVSEIAGAPARQCCEHHPRPRCCFAIQPAA